jgi:hypothetical protein
VAADEILAGAHEGLPGQVQRPRIHSAVIGTVGKCVGWSAAPGRQALGSLLGSFTAVRRRSPATAGILSMLVTNTGGRW